MFELLDDELYREVRKMIIACVLHTDMSHHFKMVSQMEVFYEVHSEDSRQHATGWSPEASRWRDRRRARGSALRPGDAPRRRYQQPGQTARHVW